MREISAEVVRALIREGKRVDGRGLEEHRPIRMEVGILSNADGSALVSYGNTTVIAAVYGPREVHPKHIALPDRAILRVRYHMAPFSTADERKNPAPSRREIEISKIIREALEPVILFEQFPRTTIDIFLEVIQADGSTRVTAITAASLALADAGIPMKDLVVGVSVGKIENALIIDLNGIEDYYCDGDMPLALMGSKKLITLMQADGSWSIDEIERALELALKVSDHIYRMERDALKAKYIEVSKSISTM